MEPDYRLIVYPKEFFAIRWQPGDGLILWEVHMIAGIDEHGPIYMDDRDSDGSMAIEKMAREPVDSGHMLHGQLRFDGCCNLRQANPDCMLHFCDFTSAKPVLLSIIEAVKALGPMMKHWMGETKDTALAQAKAPEFTYSLDSGNEYSRSQNLETGE